MPYLGGPLDYYEVLGVTRNADDITVKKAYRKLSLELHPDNNPKTLEKFNRVCEAYQVLADPKLKGFYDLFGEDALKNGIPDNKGGVKGGFFSFDDEKDPDEVFRKFFGTNNPFEALNDITATFESLTTQPKPKKGKKKTFPVRLTLEELYYGVVKHVQHKRKVLVEEAGERKAHLETVDLVIDVPAGTANGTNFIFDGKGNETPDTLPGPVIYVLEALPHDRFSRSGHDLVHHATIPVFHALAGTTYDLETLDGRTLQIPISEIATPGHTLTVEGEGLPIPEQPGTRGNLLVVINILFPTFLSETQRMLLHAAFYLPDKLNNEQTKAVRAFEWAFKDELKGWAVGFEKE
uniref:DnaJ homolog subfamily B member 4 n=1 Tax=Tetraselmis sp. GSL018 TaxID=582737 RepID=A0A061RV16_9CHLO|mmetsp:Transcript_42658/g.101284  ORF Transcript_42658/g.101284 Transcript_42658/m.101284 type:complete len:350 (+) Transcript_42658:182-1231(+)